MRNASLAVLALVVLTGTSVASAQQPAPPDHTHDQAPAPPLDPRAWSVTLDGTLFATFNHQGGRRGETEFRSQNWLMAHATRRLGPGSFSALGMLSVEPLTAPGRGYSEIFQGGEAYEGLQITDHQHPHDLLMQLSAAWSLSPSAGTSVTIAGALVGEPALGPVPFMHRASSAENPTAPLSHHILDSTHMSSGVVLGRIDRGIFSIETSVFRGREADEHRYDLDLGALDSWSIRGWVRPTPSWDIQLSHGFLEEPEALEPGDQRRTSASASWTRLRASGFTAVTAAFGRNRRPFSTLDAVLAEGTLKRGRWSLYGRVEYTEVETEILLFPGVVHVPHPGELVDTVRAFTAGAVRDVATTRGLAWGIGGDVTAYGVPPILQNTHDARPVSFHVFLRVARSDPSRRMWNMTMAGHGARNHGHH